MRILNLFTGTRYVGQAQGERKTYYVFEGDAGFLLVAPTSNRGFYVSIIDREAPGVVAKGFKSQKLTAKRLKKSGRRPDLFGRPFAALGTLYVMVALGRATKLKQHEGKSLVFKIR